MSSEIQFDQAEFSQAPGRVCGSCKVLLEGEYFAINQQAYCRNCADQFRKILGREGLGAGRFMQAILLGSGAALLGAAAYAAIMIIGEMELALVSIGIGWFVGSAIRRGSKGRGGWRYQLLAAFLTYTAICAAYGAAVWYQTEAAERSAGLLVWIIVNGYTLPFLGGTENIIGMLIVGFGVWQAWKMNSPIQLEITGPHAIAPVSTSASSANAGL